MPTLFAAQTKTKGSPPASLLPKHLGYYVERPKGLRFETQADDEHVVLFLRQHPVVLVPAVLLAVVMLAAPVFVFPLFFRVVALPFVLPLGHIIVGTLFWYLFTFGVLLSTFLGWFFNIYIVTNRRVVDIDFINLLYKKFSEANLSKIQDITYSSNGIIAAFFNYGTVLIQTAAEIQDIEYDHVPRPDKVVETIRSLIKEEKGAPV